MAAKQDVGPSLDWQSDKTLLDACSHMLKSEIACDVTFLVGDKEEKVCAHKFILVCRSTVFEAMLSGEFSDDKEDIKVPDIEPDIFRSFLT